MPAKLTYIKSQDDSHQSLRETQIANNSLIVALHTISFTPAENKLLVYVNGVLSEPQIDYIENTNNSITFKTGKIKLGDVITFIKLGVK